MCLMSYKDPDKQRQYQRERNARIRAEYLKDKSCKVCDTKKLLEVDHIDPKKKVSHKVWSWSKEKREKELKKCQILCRKHHQDKTSAYRKSKMKHGTLGMYKGAKCRCVPCRKANSTYEQNRRNAV
jgi:5-methylcytosine-specific restriction endonuclease McrA